MSPLPTMLRTAVFSVILAAAAALSFPPVDLPTSCAAVLCQVGTVCRVEPNQNGDLQAQCVAPAKPKPGDCPSPDPFDMGLCAKASMCSQDSECDGDQKCCKNSCGGFTCQQPRPSCDTTKCEPGQKCEMQDVACVREPCDPQPVCVDDGKAWECPAPEPSEVGICAFTCNSDSDCDGDRKCCKNGCGGTNCRSPPSQITTTPVPTRPACATVRCGPGKTCVMKPPRDCDSDPCYPQPYCVDIEKPGECPRSKSSYIRFGWFLCRSRCRSDADCLGDKKCCTAGCGKRCKDPVPRTCATMDCLPDHTCVMKTECNKGGCSQKPVCEPVKRCPFYPMWVNPNCVPRHDCVVGDPGACSAGYLCCSTDCGRRCVRPLE